jgi:hypothetical protein
LSQQDGVPRTGGRTGPAQRALDGCLAIAAFHDNSIRAFRYTGHAARAVILIDKIDAAFTFLDGRHRTDIGASAALIANMDAVITGCRKATLDAKYCQRRLDFPEIFNGAGQATGRTTRTSFINCP